MSFVLNRVRILIFFLSYKQGQGFKPSAAHLYANNGRVSLPFLQGGRIKCQLVKSRKKKVKSLVYYCFSASVDKYSATSKSFIFSLVDKEGLAPFKSMVKHASSSKAIYRWSSYGPTFGGWRHDIHISDYANQNTNSFTNFGNSYSPPNGVTDRHTILAGARYFSPDEVEVFYLA